MPVRIAALGIILVSGIGVVVRAPTVTLWALAGSCLFCSDVLPSYARTGPVAQEGTVPIDSVMTMNSAQSAPRGPGPGPFLT